MHDAPIPKHHARRASSPYTVQRTSSIVHRPTSTVHRPTSTVHRPPSTVHRPASSVRSPCRPVLFVAHHCAPVTTDIHQRFTMDIHHAPAAVFAGITELHPSCLCMYLRMQSDYLYAGGRLLHSSGQRGISVVVSRPAERHVWAAECW